MMEDADWDVHAFYELELASSSTPAYTNSTSAAHLQPHGNHHLTCLKLGKRPCHSRDPTKYYCQVEGCRSPLSQAKEYHRRHKVCQLHAKAPRVALQGVDQRFCQQCSRFHVISEFDDAKRSCRRRLAGHNERRRKSNTHDSIMPNSSIHSLATAIAIGGAAGQRYPNVPTSPGRALSLLSSEASPWGLTHELTSRSSAALYELIAENRAAILTHQICSDHTVWPNSSTAGINSNPPQNWQHQLQVTAPPRHLTNGWAQLNDANGHVTLDLMQAPRNSLKRKGRNGEEDCSEIWKSLEGRVHMLCD